MLTSHQYVPVFIVRPLEWCVAANCCNTDGANSTTGFRRSRLSVPAGASTCSPATIYYRWPHWVQRYHHVPTFASLWNAIVQRENQTFINTDSYIIRCKVFNSPPRAKLFKLNLCYLLPTFPTKETEAFSTQLILHGIRSTCASFIDFTLNRLKLP